MRFRLTLTLLPLRSVGRRQYAAAYLPTIQPAARRSSAAAPGLSYFEEVHAQAVPEPARYLSYGHLLLLVLPVPFPFDYP
jgi:hypothetical protein